MIEAIMDFVFNNLFIVIIVIAVVSNLISGSKKTQRQQEQRESQHSGPGEAQTRKPESLEEKIERNLKKFENIFEEEKEVIEKKVAKSQPLGKFQTSIEEQRKKQRDALANRFQAHAKTTGNVIEKKSSTDSVTVIKHHSNKTSVTKKALKKRMSKRGLQESVVMAEVLGKPRALKPYSTRRVD